MEYRRGHRTATGDGSVQRARGLDGSPEASSGWTAEQASVPELVAGLGRPGFHTEMITGRLSPTFLWIQKGNIILPFGNYFLFLVKEMATHSSILAWRIPWTEEPGRPWSIGSQRVGHDLHDWAQLLSFSTLKMPSHCLLTATVSLLPRLPTWPNLSVLLFFWRERLFF